MSTKRTVGFGILEFGFDPGDGGDGEVTQPPVSEDPPATDTTAPTISILIDSIPVSKDGAKPSLYQTNSVNVLINIEDNNFYFGDSVTQSKVTIEINKKKDTTGAITSIWSRNIIAQNLYDYTSQTGDITFISISNEISIEFGYRYMIDVIAFDNAGNGRESKRYLRFVIIPNIDYSAYTLVEETWSLTLELGFDNDESLHYVETHIRLDNPQGDLYIALNMSIYDYANNRYRGNFDLLGLPEGTYYPIVKVVYSTVEPGGLVDIIDYRTIIANTNNEYYPTITIEYETPPTSVSTPIGLGNETKAYGILIGSITIGVVILGASITAAIVRKRRK